MRVTVSDASLASTPLTSAPVTILNTAPSATVSLDDHSPGTNATLTATATSDDARRRHRHPHLRMEGERRDTPDHADVSADRHVRPVASRTTATTARTSASPSRRTTAPTTAGPSSTPRPSATPPRSWTRSRSTRPRRARTTRSSATVTSHDADGDALTTGYQWTRTATTSAARPAPTLDLSVAGNGDQGDLIRVRVTVSDGTATLRAGHLSPRDDRRTPRRSRPCRWTTTRRARTPR